MNRELKDAIMEAVSISLERADMQTPCTFPVMTSSEYGVCDADGFPISDETIASALNAVARIQQEYNKARAPVDPRIAEVQSVANGIAKLSEEQRKAQEMKPCGN